MIGDYEYKTHTKEDSQFSSTLDQFATVFAERMRKNLNDDLADRLTLVMQKGTYALFRRLQQNHKVKGKDILMNKHMVQLCYVQGSPLEYDRTGQVIQRNSGAFSFEIDGTFHRSSDLLDTNTASDVLLSGSHSVTPGNFLIQIGKPAFDSIISAMFKESGKIVIDSEPIIMKVEELEEMAEGFANAFDEDDEIKITAEVNNVLATQFDQDFGNIPIKAVLTINFSNPINEKFLSASAKVFVKGTAEIIANDNSSFGFKFVQEKVKVQSFTPYFLSETELADFEKEYL